MKIHGLMIAAVIFVVLAGLFYWSERREARSDTVKSVVDTPPGILKLEEGKITKLQIKKKDASPIVLAKGQSGNWQITQPRTLSADQNTVSAVLSTLSSLNSERLVEDKAADLKTYGLDQPSLEVDITEADRTHRLLLGDDTPTGGAVYAMLSGDLRVFTISSFGKRSVDKSLNDLRDKRLMTASSDRISRIELIRKNQEIEFGRVKEEWQILKPRPLRADSSKVEDVVQKLIGARMDLTESPDDNKKATVTFAHATPIATAKVTDPSGTQEIQIRKKSDAYYAKSSVVEGAYKVESDVALALNKDLDDFRNKKLFDFGFSDPNRIELHSPLKTYLLTRSGEEWSSNGKKVDATSVQSLVSKCRELTAKKFLDSGFTNPTLDVSVTSDDGKRTEKVLIAKSHGSYIGKRENEPVLYELDSSSVDELVKAADDIKSSPAPGK